jgi:NAD(P)-dependent dehydrogenase (short-subunit alcohol dehydrogenase family)
MNTVRTANRVEVIYLNGGPRMEFEGKVVLITGAGGSGAGQGRAFALAFAAEGADVAVNDIALDKAEATAKEIRALGRRALAVKADVSDEAEVNAMVDSVVREFGGIDILVNNAGFGLPILVEDMTAEEWHRTIAVNLDGPFFCSRAVIPIMKKRGGGRIINIASPAGKTMTFNACAAYSSAKAGVMGFTRHLAFEVGPYKITVNSVCPIVLVGGEQLPPPEVIQKMKDSALLGDVNTPQDSTYAVLFLASDRAKMITGTNVDAYPIAPGGKEYWDTFVNRRKDFKAKKKDKPLEFMT